jgi:hypothetical protein
LVPMVWTMPMVWTLLVTKMSTSSGAERFAARVFGAWPLAWPSPSGPLGWQRLRGQQRAAGASAISPALDTPGIHVVSERSPAVPDPPRLRGISRLQAGPARGLSSRRRARGRHPGSSARR